VLGAARRDPEVIPCVLLAYLASHGTSPTHLRVIDNPYHNDTRDGVACVHGAKLFGHIWADEGFCDSNEMDCGVSDASTMRKEVTGLALVSTVWRQQAEDWYLTS
jgi:hypothetical protein